MEYINPLGVEKIHKLILKFSVPAIFGMLVSSLYNIVDRIFIGNASDLGANGLAGITIGFPIMIILMAMGILFGVGGATLFSIRLGQQKKEQAENILGNSFMMLLIAGISFMILGQIFLEPMLKLFGASEAVLPYSVAYMRVIFFGAIFQVVSMGMNNFIRADGNPKLAMLTMFIGAGINIVLDPIFIFVFKWGMTGAALATILAQAVSAIWVVSYFLGRKSHSKLRLENMKLQSENVRRITALGLPGFSLHLASSLLNTILNRSLLFYGGDIAVSGMGIINSIAMLLVMPVIGLNQGVQPIVSYNYGAKNVDRIKSAQKIAILAATATVCVGYLVTRLFPEQLIGMFNQEPELLKFGSTAINSWFLALPVVGFQIIAANFFQAIGRPKTAMFLTLTRQVILLIPAVLIFPRIWGMEGLLYAAPFADILAAILTGSFYFKGIRRLQERESPLVDKG
ncbi:MAG: MATE family efflux transporter [Eubacteriaceae bacterium]|nr:MATE family efflux transporter [Eubacteriaceae bacterium]